MRSGATPSFVTRASDTVPPTSNRFSRMPQADSITRRGSKSKHQPRQGNQSQGIPHPHTPIPMRPLSYSEVTRIFLENTMKVEAEVLELYADRIKPTAFDLARRFDDDDDFLVGLEGYTPRS